MVGGTTETTGDVSGAGRSPRTARRAHHRRPVVPDAPARIGSAWADRISGGTGRWVLGEEEAADQDAAKPQAPPCRYRVPTRKAPGER